MAKKYAIPTVYGPLGHKLDMPIWNALSSEQRRFSRGSGLALRYAGEFAPFAATADSSIHSIAPLGPLIPQDEFVGLFTVEEVRMPASLTCTRHDQFAQMVLDSSSFRISTAMVPVEMRALGAPDVSAMMELVALTQPGPFAARTIELGTYVGLFADATLIAMAGERMSFEKFVEIGAVCTHPSHQGKGLAKALVSELSAAALRRGKTPFLHASAENGPALAVYSRLGFSIRRMMHLTVLRHSLN